MSHKMLHESVCNSIKRSSDYEISEVKYIFRRLQVTPGIKIEGYPKTFRKTPLPVVNHDRGFKHKFRVEPVQNTWNPLRDRKREQRERIDILLLLLLQQLLLLQINVRSFRPPLPVPFLRITYCI